MSEQQDLKEPKCAAPLDATVRRDLENAQKRVKALTRQLIAVRHAYLKCYPTEMKDCYELPIDQWELLAKTIADTDLTVMTTTAELNA